jgi:Zn-dependent peptidase ImmA (M78 family)
VSRSDYYREMRVLADGIRDRYGLQSARVLKSDLRRIYKDQRIRIDLWPYKLKKLRGAYFNDESGPSVLLAKGLPDDPMIFTMGHELKHHLVDREKIVSLCDPSNQSAEVEIGAEIFAAELIYPEEMFRQDLIGLGASIGSCTPVQLVTLKRQTGTTLSYAGIAKRAAFLGFAPQGSLAKIAWKNLEESIYGVPIYKQRFLARRGR